MVWLTVHMWLIIAIAFVIGLAAGWWIWGAQASAAAAQEETPMGSLDLDQTTDEQTPPAPAKHSL